MLPGLLVIILLIRIMSRLILFPLSLPLPMRIVSESWLSREICRLSKRADGHLSPAHLSHSPTIAEMRGVVVHYAENLITNALRRACVDSSERVVDL